MIINIMPTIRNYYKNQIDLCFDKKLISLLKTNYKGATIKCVNSLNEEKFDLLVLTGGNTVIGLSNKEKDLARSKFDNFYYKKAIQKQTPIIGICHGAQFIAKKFKGVIKKNKKVGMEKIIFFNNKVKKIKLYHDYSIKKISKDFEILAKTCDGYIESFSHKKKNIYGIMWHPERNQTLNFIDKIVLKSLCS